MTVCVTGPMAAGKNTVSAMLEGMKWQGMGFAAADADKFAHTAIGRCTEEITAAFGGTAAELGIALINADGSVNRRNLGAIVFSRPELLQKQEAIVFPHVQLMCEQFIAEQKSAVPPRHAILNATVLHKIPVIADCDIILYVDAPLFVRLWRARRRDGIRVPQLLARFRAQRKLFSKYRSANADIYRVWNAGSPDALQKRVREVLLRHHEETETWTQQQHSTHSSRSH